MTPEMLGVEAELAPVVPIKLLLSILIVLATMAARWLLVRLVRGRDDILSDRQRYWISLVKNVSSAVVVLALFVLWLQEIEDFALSIAAVAVAVVIATKELWLCVTGATWRGVSQAFSVGDWIEIGPHSGEVIDENLLATVLQEIDPYDYNLTGRVVSVPNSLLLSAPVVNNSFRKRFIYFSLDIHAEPGGDALAARDRVQAAVEAASADFGELARRYAARIEKTAGARLRDPAPLVSVHTTELAKIVLRVTAFCPRERTAMLREAAMTAFLAVPPPRPA